MDMDIRHSVRGKIAIKAVLLCVTLSLGDTTACLSRWETLLHAYRRMYSRLDGFRRDFGVFVGFDVVSGKFFVPNFTV